MADPCHSPSKSSLAGFWVTLGVVNSVVMIAAAIYASRFAVPAAVAVPVAAAFLLQASIYLIPGFPAVRRRIERRFTAPRLALLLAGVSVAPYLIYSIPTNVFSWLSFFTLAGYCLVISLLFVIMPARGQMLCWQDGVVLCLLAYPMVSGLSTMFQDIYRSPHEAIPLPSLRPLGQLMLMPLAATAYLSFRGLKRVGFRFAVSREDFVTGVRNFLLFLPIGMPLALVIGFAHWDAKPLTGWYPLELAGNSLAFYMTVGLSEELYFRGILQNLTAESLRKPLAARLVVSVLFGFAHISRGFPNWPYVAVAATMGWFCGRAYSQSYSVVASSVTHTLVVVVQRFFFPRI